MKKLTAKIKAIPRWFARQFKEHTVRSVAVTVPVAALITLGILFLCGVFTSIRWSYLPNRAFILAETETEEPQTLYELLHSDTPSVDTLLRNPAIAEEILNAESLIEIVDSRFALYNLRELDSQITERLELSVEDVYLLDLPDDESPADEASQQATPQADTGEAASVARLSYEQETGREIAAAPLANVQAGAYKVSESIVADSAALTKLSSKMEGLLVPAYFGETVQIGAAINLKGIWQNGETLLHLTPSGDWLPEGGYDLYRTVNGQKVLVESGVASPRAGEDGALTYKDESAENVQNLYKKAALSDKLGTLGMNEEQFKQEFYVTDTLARKPRMSGAEDFTTMKNLTRTVYGTTEQKIPENDVLINSTVFVIGRQPNGIYTSAEIQSAISKKLSVTQTNVLARSNAFLSRQDDESLISKEDQKKRALAQEVLDARQQLTTMSFVDPKFADDANFLIHDDLSALDIPDGTVITYTASYPDGSVSASLNITMGVEFPLSQPTELDGFGADGRVPLRWSDAASDAEKSIIVGYNIERKLDGENSFTQISDTPVAISHMLEDAGIYMEAVVFYEDEVENGREAQYRIRSIDIFGRMSEYSDILIINESSTKKVEKITPPNAPSLSSPTLSTDTTSEKSAAVQASIDQNGGSAGVVLPIFTESPDTARFTIYRAVAVGAGGFGAPEILANIMYDNPIPADSEVYSEAAEDSTEPSNATPKPVYKKAATSTFSLENTKLKLAKQLVLNSNTPLEPSIAFFDADIQEGHTYKYWVSAWDDPEWNNESAWSPSVTVGVSTDALPAIPGALNIQMLSKELPDLSALPPGIVLDTKITGDILSQQMVQNLPSRQYAADVDTETVALAEAAGVSIGNFVTGAEAASLSSIVSLDYDNLPDDRYIHMFTAIRGEDVKVNGSAYLNWPAYSGSGLKGYVVYKPVTSAALPSLAEMQSMTSRELLELCQWRKVSDAITQNQLMVSGLNSAPGSLNLFLICLEPEHNYASSKYVAALLAKKAASTELVEPVKPAAPKAPTPSSINSDELGSVSVSFFGLVTFTAPNGSVYKYNTGLSLFSYPEAERYKHYKDCLRAAIDILLAYTDPPLGQLMYLTPYSNAFGAAADAYEAHLAAYPGLLEAYEEELAAYEAAVYLALISGNVKIEWDAPDDPQIKYYRVYRSEVTKKEFQNQIGEDALEWTMVGDHVTAAQFTDPVEQSFAHYYYYKVTAVTAWGVESDTGVVQGFRVPATVPPATPNMQIPLSSKNGVKVNFSAVSHCDRYIVYRTEITRLTQSQIDELKAGNEAIFGAIFTPVSTNDTFMSQILNTSLTRIGTTFSSSGTAQQGTGDSSSASIDDLLSVTQPGAASSATPVAAQVGQIGELSKFKTVSQIDKSALRRGLAAVSNEAQLNFVQHVVDNFGPLVVADYADLSFALMQKVKWDEVGVLPVTEDTVESSEGNNIGLLKPLFIEDTTAKYGHRYLYTVRAWNDDDLGSMASEPVEGASRRDGPFDPIDGINGEIQNAHPNITWNPPQMKRAPLTLEERIEDTVGYIVYRADKEEGPYYQASPLLFNTGWVDEEADIFANNWYNVKVLDTGGYLSEFGDPVNVRLIYINKFKPFIPIIVLPEAKPPVVSIPGGPHTVMQGETLVIPFTVTGDEPITYKIEGSARNGTAITGMTVDLNAKTITIPNTLPVGAYGATLTAENAAGTGQASFNFTVEDSAVAPKIAFSGSRFNVQQGAELQVPYTVTGTEPITVTITAKNSTGADAVGFTNNFDAGSGTRFVLAPGYLNADTYTVTATAKNSVGESTASFTLSVASSRTAPVIVDERHGYHFDTSVGQAMSVFISATGSTPITWSLAASGKMALPSFVSINALTGELTVTSRAARGDYYFVVKAENDVGSDTQECSLSVIETRTAPKITNGIYEDKMTRGTDYELQFTATGSEPLYWSLEPVQALTHFATVPEEVTIDGTGRLNIKGSIAVGSYSFIVRVTNDLGSDTLEFTITVESGRIIIRPPVGRTGALDLSSPLYVSPLSTGSDATVTQLAVVQPTAPPSSIPQPNVQQSTPTVTESFKKDIVMCDTPFALYDVNGTRPRFSTGLEVGYSGTAMLDIGYAERIPVNFVDALFEDKSSPVSPITSIMPTMTSGTIYLPEPVTLESVGITIVSLELKPMTRTAIVSGYAESTTEGRNLVGNIGVLEFTDAYLRPGSINVADNLSDIRYDQFTFCKPLVIILNFSDQRIQSNGFLTMGCEYVLMKSHLETLDNQDIRLTSDSNSPTDQFGFDIQGRIISGRIATRPQTEQALQLLVPGGSMLRISEASLSFKDGKVESNGTLKGRLILPFENPDKFGSGKAAEGVYAAPEHPESNELDKLLASSSAGGLPEVLVEQMQDGLIKFGETVQSKGLLIVSRDTELQNLYAYAAINVYDWAGAGFTQYTAAITPTNVAERKLDIDTQRKQGITVRATAKNGVNVDLDRDRALKQSEGYPNETGEDFWVGLIYPEGSVTLPSSYVKTESGQPIVFTLAPGEMIYDLNGFNYQTYLYAPSEEGVKAQTGSQLGNFPDAWIHDVMVDMYNNKVDLEINMTVAVDFLMGNRVKAKLYTLKEPDENGNLPGTFLCSVAPTIVESAIAPMFDLRIDGGWFEPDGMRISGALLLPAPEFGFGVISDDPLEFTDMVIPADRTKTYNSEKYGYVALDKPVNVDFNGFTVEVRVLNMDACRDPSILPIPSGRPARNLNRIDLLGATVVSDNIPLSTENTDWIKIRCTRSGAVLSAPTQPNNLRVDYDASTSVLNNTFDESFTVTGTLRQKEKPAGGASAINSGGTGSGVSNLLYTSPAGGGDGYMTLADGEQERFTEYELDEMAFGFLDSLALIPFETETRMGKDNELGRYYFAIGLMYTGAPVEFGFGQISDIAGIVTYNMVVERDPSRHNRFVFPHETEAIVDHIINMDVYTGSGTKFAAAIHGTLDVLHLCQIRDLYFAFESGPIVEAGGDFFVPLNPGAVLGDDAFTKIGSVIIMYNHPARHFSINVDLEYKVMAIEIYGNINLQWNPKLFGVYIGYPEMLTAKIPMFKAGAGFAFQAGDEESFVAARVKLNWKFDADIGIVYLGGYIEGGADGKYIFDGPESGSFSLKIYLKGGMKGGIWFFGRRDIISFYLNAQGSLNKRANQDWKLKASCEVGYSISLFIDSISGSVHVGFDTSF